MLLNELKDWAERSPRRANHKYLRTWEETSDGRLTCIIKIYDTILGTYHAWSFIKDDAGAPTSDKRPGGSTPGDDFDFDGAA
jgi:hypothetical protein